MKATIAIAALLGIALCFPVLQVAAQRSQQMPDQSNSGGMSGMMSGNGNMMSGGMMDCQRMMPSMMARHQEMENLVEQSVKSFSDLENEKDPALLKKKLGEHGALLKELQTKMQQHSAMMKQMMNQGSMPGDMKQ